MKKKYLASLTIASMLLPTIAASQIGVASENEVKTQETSQTADVPVTPPSVETPQQSIPETAPAPEAVQTPEADPVESAPQNSEAIETPASIVPEESVPSEPKTVPTPENQSSTEIEGKSVEVNPLDVEPFPPNVPTDTAPAINIIPVQTIIKGSTFDPMAGVSATDKTDGDITSKVTFTGTVDVNVEGSYLLTYSVTNSKGQTTTQSAHIMVVDSTIGMYSIELADFSIPKGADYIQAIRERIVIKDADGTIIPTASANIQVSGHHSTDKAGKISVEVAVLSTYNTVTKKVVTITITDESSVRIDANDVSLKVGDTFDPYAYAKGFSMDAAGIETPLNPAADASSTGLFVVSNEVDTSKAGTYQVVYQAKNDSGQVATKTIKVTVSEDKSERVPKIIVEDKLMYVGDKLTTDMILAWASTENPDDFITGFKVLNGKIKVKLIDDTLVEPGVHQFMFYAKTAEGKTAEKTMTLTVKEKEAPVDGVDKEMPAQTPSETPTKEIASDQTKVTGTNKVKKLAVTKNEQKGSVKTTTNDKLPETGDDSKNLFLSMCGLLVTTISAFFLSKKKGLIRK